MRLPVAALLLGLTEARFKHSHGSTNGLLISTSSGRIQGTIDPNLPNTRQFLGIPYAQPPLDDLRWAPPQALVQPNKPINAIKLPPSCPQFLSSLGNSIYTNNVLQFNLQGLNRTGNVSEDCLTLSVWTPTVEHCRESQIAGHHAGLPVLIFIYGGALANGGENVPYQIPAQWVERTKDHVVVSFNYRVNIFGFPNAKGLESQNLGLQDQRLLIEWCKQNIAAFGGDPNRMVLWGQSAGAASADYYNYAHYQDPIVTGLILDSGSVFLSTGSDPAHTNFTFVADHVGCDGLANDPTKQLACMRTVPAGTIENFIANYANRQESPGLSFEAIADNMTVFSNYTDRALQGKLANIPAIYGNNAQDGVALAPYRPNGPDPEVAQEVLLEEIVCPATLSIQLRQRAQRTSYRFVYHGNFSNISPLPWMGAYHSAELPMLMGTHANYRGPSTPLEYATSHAMQDAWLAFAADPQNGLASQHWSEYQTLGAKQVRDFGDGIPVKDASIADLERMCVAMDHQ